MPGNHDSVANRAELAALSGITVLDGEVATVGDVRILGIADPTFTASNEVSTEEATAIKASLTDEVRAAVRSTRPDVLAVHDPAQAATAMGAVPVVAAGHVHKRTERTVDGTLVLRRVSAPSPWRQRVPTTPRCCGSATVSWWPSTTCRCLGSTGRSRSSGD